MQAAEAQVTKPIHASLGSKVQPVVRPSARSALVLPIGWTTLVRRKLVDQSETSQQHSNCSSLIR